MSHFLLLTTLYATLVQDPVTNPCAISVSCEARIECELNHEGEDSVIAGSLAKGRCAEDRAQEASQPSERARNYKVAAEAYLRGFLDGASVVHANNAVGFAVDSVTSYKPLTRATWEAQLQFLDGFRTKLPSKKIDSKKRLALDRAYVEVKIDFAKFLEGEANTKLNAARSNQDSRELTAAISELSAAAVHFSSALDAWRKLAIEHEPDKEPKLLIAYARVMQRSVSVMLREGVTPNCAEAEEAMHKLGDEVVAFPSLSLFYTRAQIDLHLCQARVDTQNKDFLEAAKHYAEALVLVDQTQTEQRRKLLTDDSKLSPNEVSQWRVDTLRKGVRAYTSVRLVPRTQSNLQLYRKLRKYQAVLDPDGEEITRPSFGPLFKTGVAIGSVGLAALATGAGFLGRLDVGYYNCTNGDCDILPDYLGKKWPFNKGVDTRNAVGNAGVSLIIIGGAATIVGTALVAHSLRKARMSNLTPKAGFSFGSRSTFLSLTWNF